MSSRYYLTFKSTFQPEKPIKLDKTSFNVKFFDWDYLHLTAETKETYFSWNFLEPARKKNLEVTIILSSINQTSSSANSAQKLAENAGMNSQ